MALSRSTLLLLPCTLLFLAAMSLNITTNTPLFNLHLNAIPHWQDALDNKGFIFFMNVMSNLFNPVVCAAYIGLIWIVSHRKLEIMVFLVWFIFVSWVLTLLKMVLK